MLIGVAIGFVLGVAATLLYNFYFPKKVAAATAEVGAEVEKLKKKT